MYSVAESLPLDELEPGALLLSAPAMAGKYDLLLDLVAEGIHHDEGVIFVTTNETAAGVVDDLGERVNSTMDQVYVVDCGSDRPAHDLSVPEEQVDYLSSPADLTGIGIGVSERLRSLSDAGVTGTRVALHSVSTLLMYSNLETVFRFVHVITGRIATVDGLGVFAVDPTSHEDGTLNTLKQLFDGVIELRDDDGRREVRVVGIPDGPTEWVPRA